MTLDIDASATIAAPAAEAHSVLADLATYPQWLGIVRRVGPAAGDPDDGGPAWLVELGARLGPFWRTKTLRMVRTRTDPPASARFERRELDGRTHSPWVLDAVVTPVGTGCEVAVHLHYGGTGWATLLEPVLRIEAAKAGGRLTALLT